MDWVLADQKQVQGMVRERNELAKEIERLRLERDELADLLRRVDVVMDGAAIMGVGEIMAPQYRDDWALVHTRVRERLALLDGEGGGNDAFTTTYRQMDEDSDCWECTADDCNEAWCLNGEGTPSANNMRYCHGCGRRIVAEEPWEDGDGDE